MTLATSVLLFYEINVILSNFSFSKSTESLQTSLHHQHASKRLWSVHPKDYGACIQKIMERASKSLWSVHPKDYGACIQKFMERGDDESKLLGLNCVTLLALSLSLPVGVGFMLIMDQQ